MILPLVVLRRLDCVLEPTKDEVLAAYERHSQVLTDEDALAPFLLRAAGPGAQFYNTSRFTFARLLLPATPVQDGRVTGGHDG